MPLLAGVAGACLWATLVYFIPSEWMTFADWHYCHFIPTNPPPAGADGLADCISTRTLVIMGSALFGWSFGLLLGQGKVEFSIGDGG